MRAHMRAIAFAAVWLAACNGSSDEDLLAKAETLCLDQEYAEAMVVLREHLLDQPFDAGAHYYLGLCYMAASEGFRPVIAKGEFETALRLFEEQGGASPIERFTAEYFEMMCYVNQGKTTLREIDVLASMGAQRYHIEPLIDRAETYADAARAVLPDAEEVAWLDGMIDTMTGRDWDAAAAEKAVEANGN